MTSFRFRLRLAAAALAAAALPIAAQTFVIRDVNVVSMTSPKIAEKQNVIVRDGKIESVSDRLAKMPDGTTVIDGTGRYLMPGLAEMHGHIPPPNSPAGLLDDVLYLYLANGVTTVRGMLGHDGQLNLREWQKSGQIVAPNLYVAGPAFNGQTVKTPEEAIARVRAQKKEGWDLLKIHEGLTLPVYDAIAKTAKQEGMRFGGHVPDDVGLIHAIEMGQETFDHMDGFVEYLNGEKGPVDRKKLAALVKRAKKAGIWIVPTSALWEVLFNAVPVDTLRAYPELKYVPEGAADAWAKAYADRAAKLPAAAAKNVIENRERILRAMNEGGVKILMGTDSPQQFSIPGFSLHRELQTMRAAGMTPYQILRSGTANVGQYFAKQDSFGTIEPGKRADLVLLEANPLADVANVSRIQGVMVRGRWYSREAIDKRLAEIEKKYPRK